MFKSGIYKIVHRDSGKIYVGQAVNIFRRWLDHKKSLRLGKHYNIKLQRAWAKHGEEAFDFIVIEYCFPEFLTIREQHWINVTNCCNGYIGYNLAPIANSNLGLKLSEATKLKMSKSAQNRSIEHKAKLGFTNKGRKHSEETKAKMKLLVGDEKDPIKKAKLIYDYVQKKVRYVSIQEGIGGWKPMPASDVDRLGYGDCKALTNYTKALLTAVDVPSYYTKLYGSNYKTDIVSDFVSQQGNHIILAIPIGSGYTWLECTSQDDPFGFQGTFTDDRTVLVVKPSGGEIVRTNVYHDEGNTQQDRGTYTLSANGDLSGKITIVSQGSQYSRKAPIQNWNPLEKESHYKEYWDNINNLKLEKIAFSNDKENIKFTENIEINAVNYGAISNGKMMFAVNVFNQYTGSIKRIRNRKNPFEIQRGYVDTDEINVVLPLGFSIEFLPANFELNSKYGAYKTEIIKKDATNLIYKRTLFVKKGLYSNKEYDEYRLFMEQISKNDNAKIILTLN